MRSLVYIVLLVICFLLLEYLHIDASKGTTEHSNDIVLVYSKPTPQNELTSEIIVLELDSLNIALDSMLTDEESPIVSDSTFFSQLVQDINLQENENKDLPIIRYYSKPKDGKKVYVLRKYGYYIHERPSTNLDYYTSNSISYGDSVTEKDLLLISYLLISEGVDIKKIALSKYHSGWKYHSVEIGTDTTITKNASITLSDLRNKWMDM